MLRFLISIIAVHDLWSQAIASSFKVESAGMIVQGQNNLTVIDHRRPVTDVRPTVIDV